MSEATTFSQLNLSDPVARAIEAMGFTTATDIQAQSIPLLREGYDVVGRSQTGTGKTIAFGIPAVEVVETGEGKNLVQVLILCPTRELSMQACAEIRKLARFKPGVKTVDIYGGAPMTRQIYDLKNGANVVVGTPGRVMDHMRRGTLKLGNLKMVVLDEADEMLSMGFKEDIETILQDAPQEKQMVLFSATMPPAILALTSRFQKDPQVVEIDRSRPSVEAINQTYYEVPMGRKLDALSMVLRYQNPQLCMIFCNTKTMTEEVAQYLQKQGLAAEALHGDMKQQQRTAVLGAFKSHRTHILVATDVAARGIDVENIDYVINYDIPQSSEYYIHRIGRTGRAGKDGCAITICSGRKQAYLIEQIARITKSKITHQAMPSARDIATRQMERSRLKVEEQLSTPADEVYVKMAQELLTEDRDASQVVAALLQLHFGAVPKADETASFAPDRSPRVADSKMGRIVLSIGRNHRAAPNHIVGAVTEFTGLSGRDIGKIEIYDDETVVSVPQDNMETTLASLQNCKICGQATTAKEYRGGAKVGAAPAFGRGRPDRARSGGEHREKDYRHLDSGKRRSPAKRGKFVG